MQLNHFENAKQSCSFCLYPFVHLNFKVDGKTSPCFRSQPISSFSEPESGWNSMEWKELRRQLLNGEKPSNCSSCWKLEQAGASSYRQSSLAELDPFQSWRDSLDHYRDDGEMLRGPRQVELRFSNECNLQCRMCGPLYSSKWEKYFTENPEKEGQLKKFNMHYSRRQLEGIKDSESAYQKALFESIDSWKDSVQYIMIAGGEPLLQKQHLRLLKHLQPVAKNIVLEYSTNLSTLSCGAEDIVELWKAFKGIILKISIDGDPLIYPYVRRYGDINKLVKNLARIQQEIPEKIIKLIGTLTVSAYNVARMVEAAEFFTRIGVLFHTSVVQYPEVISSQILPSEEKIQITEKVENLNNNLNHILPIWMADQAFWIDDKRRESQKERIEKFTTSAIQFMNYPPVGLQFKEFIEYDQMLSFDKSRDLFSIYPHWREYV